MKSDDSSPFSYQFHRCHEIRPRISRRHSNKREKSRKLDALRQEVVEGSDKGWSALLLAPRLESREFFVEGSRDLIKAERRTERRESLRRVNSRLVRLPVLPVVAPGTRQVVPSSCHSGRSLENS